MKLSFAVWPGFESLGEQLNEQFHFESIKTNIRKFPDGETYVRVLSEVKGNSVLLVNS
jgi:ribose-phosphate pyrophosphokinase